MNQKAHVAQLVEHRLSTANVEGSSPFVCSTSKPKLDKQGLAAVIASGQYTETALDGSAYTNYKRLHEDYDYAYGNKPAPPDGMTDYWKERFSYIEKNGHPPEQIGPHFRPGKGKGKSQLKRALEVHGNRCHWCRCECDSSTPELKPCTDFRVNFQRGKNKFSNIVISCQTCCKSKTYGTGRKASKVENITYDPGLRVNIGDKFSTMVEHIGDAVVSVAARLLAYKHFEKEKRRYLQFQEELCRNRNFSTYPGIRHPDQFEVIIGNEYFLSGIEVAVDTATEMLKQTKCYTDTIKDETE